MQIIGAVDIGGTKISVAAIREDGVITLRSECCTHPERGFEDAMSRVQRMLRSVTESASQLCGIGIACPGPLDPATGVLGVVGTLPDWEGGNLVTELEHCFHVPVAVENDADAAALAEWKWGAQAKSDSLIYVTISTGIGGGIILSGHLYRGVDGTHPEIGHQVIDPSGPLCYCNARGCWESLASGSAMVAWMEQQDGMNGRTAADICAAARAGHALAREAVEREGRYLGLGLANLITMFAPAAVALGGGVMKSSSLFWDTAMNVIAATCTQVPLHKTTIRLASLGPDTGLLGAARAWLHRYR